MTLAVEATALVKRFGPQIALDGLDLAIPQGSIYGFIGPNGAGKTTTMRIIVGLLGPTSGTISVVGRDVVREPAAVRKLVGWMPDTFGVYDNIKSWEYLDFFAASYDVPRKRRRRLIEELLDLVDLRNQRDEYVMALSRGMKQRLSLARTLVHDPQLLVLDEPASGMDPRGRLELRALLKELSVMGKTIIISSHILHELADMCTDVGIVDRGRLVIGGDVTAVLHGLHPHRTLLIRVLERASAALALLPDLPGVAALRRQSDASIAATAPTFPADDQPATLLVDYTGDDRGLTVLFKALAAAGIPVVHFAEQTDNLEQLFMQLTGENNA
ncbi:MAG: ABC transporter ATP-binding protein [Herpetosiphon sp.]